jgi:signal transduction histidine kinase
VSNGTYLKLRSNFYVFVVPLLAAACALGATLTLSQALVSRERQQLLGRTDEEAKHVAAQLRSALVQSVDVLPRIGNWWLTQGRPEAREDWETDAQLFLRLGTGLRQVAWIDTNGKTLWSVRPGAVPDFKAQSPDADLADTLRQAFHNGTLTLSNVANRNGVPYFYACAPIRSGRLVGFVVGLFDAAALADSLLGEQVPRDYEVTVAADGRPITTLKQARSRLWRAGSRTADLKIADRLWSAQLVPTATDIDTLERAVWSFGIIVSVLLYACTALALVYKRNESTLAITNAALAGEMAQRGRAENVIQQQVADFQTLVDVLPVGLAVSNDPTCREIRVNPQLSSMLHVSTAENISSLAPGADRLPFKYMRQGNHVPADELPMQMAASTGKPVLDVELDIVREDGTVLNTLSYSVPVIDPDGNLRRVIGVCVDVTERKSLEKRLLRAEKYRSLALMAGGVAHDFNNLLTTILGNAEIARGEISPLSTAGSAISQILAAGNRAAELVGQLLAYTGHGWFELKPLDLSAEIRGLAKDLRAMTPDEVHLKFELAEGLPPVQAGAREFQHVLTNLVTNALEAIGDGQGIVRIRTQKIRLSGRDLARDYPDQKLVSGAYVGLEISDSGAGVPSELAGRVFDPFFTTKFTGRGLGLSEVQGVMRAHRGGVRLDTSPARGACVQVVFPVDPTRHVRGAVADPCA